MGQIFSPHIGCVYRTSSVSTKGAVRIAGLPDVERNVVLRSLSMLDKDMVAPVSTLDRKKILYTFGEDFGEFTAELWLLLGTSGTAPLDAVVDWFQGQRVSKASKSVEAVVGTKAYRCAVTAMRVGEANAEFRIQPLVLSGVVIDPPT